MISCASDSQTERFARNLIVPQGFAVRMKQDMRMGFNQTGHQSHARQINHLCLRRGFDFACRPNRFNLFAAHQHHPTIVQLRRLTIKDVRGFEEINRVGWFGCLCLGGGGHLSEWIGNDGAYEDRDRESHIMILSVRGIAA